MNALASPVALASAAVFTACTANPSIKEMVVGREWPVSFFGGEAAFEYGRERDRKKRELAAANGCRVLDVLSGYDLAEVVDQLRKLMSQPSQSVPIGEIRTLSEKSREAIRRVKPFTSVKSNLGAHDLRACARHGTVELIRSVACEMLQYCRDKKIGSLPLLLAAEANNLDGFKELLIRTPRATCDGPVGMDS